MTKQIQHPFIVFPAIDLRHGKVVRLKEGDPARITNYSEDPAKTAEQWINAGASWLHIVNLDAAFGEDDNDNQNAILSILAITQENSCKVQLGGGIRSLETISRHIEHGISRVILGTAVIKQPALLEKALLSLNKDQVAVSLDARDGLIQVSGWQNSTDQKAVDLARKYREMGLNWLVFTDIARDGLQTGLNMVSTCQIALESGLHVIASGGVSGWNDIYACYEAGLPGVIVGRALYENKFDPESLFRFPETNKEIE